MKRIVICCDGTWNRLDAAWPTNVVRLAEAVASQSAGSAGGWGLMTKVEQANRFLIFNYDPGDEIYIFGFSRGAYTAVAGRADPQLRDHRAAPRPAHARGAHALSRAGRGIASEC